MSRRGSRRDPVKEQFWRDTLRRQKASGLSIREFCARHKLVETAFYSWRTEIQRRDDESHASLVPTSGMRATKRSQSARRVRAKKSHDSKTKSAVERPKFLPVAVTGLAAANFVEISLPSGVVLRIGRDCDRKTLRTVLATVLEQRVETPAC
jgi:hypothetical protein